MTIAECGHQTNPFSQNYYCEVCHERHNRIPYLGEEGKPLTKRDYLFEEEGRKKERDAFNLAEKRAINISRQTPLGEQCPKCGRTTTARGFWSEPLCSVCADSQSEKLKELLGMAFVAITYEE